MARRTINAINWSGIAERLNDVDRPIFAAFRAKSDGFLRRMNEFPEKVPAIDWEFYKKNIAVAGMVDSFQKQYDSLKIPYPDDKYTSIVDDQAKTAMKAVEDFIAKADEEIVACQANIDKVNALLPFDKMTMDDAVETFDIFNPEKPTIWPHKEEQWLLEDELKNPTKSGH